MRGII